MALSVLDQLDFKDKSLLNDLQQLAPMAGSAVALPAKANDIDFFILKNDQELFKRMGLLLAPKTTSYSASALSYFPLSAETSVSIISFCIRDERLPIQLILTNHESPQKLVEQFDFDYIQAFLFKDVESKTEACRRALSANRLFSINDCHRLPRFIKVLQKEMKTYVLQDPSFSPVINTLERAYPNVVEFDANKKSIADLFDEMPISPIFERKVAPIDCEQLQVVGLKPFKNWYKPDSALACKTYYNFILQTKDGAMVPMRAVTFVASVVSVEHKDGYDFLVVNHPFLNMHNIRQRGKRDWTIGKGYGFLLEIGIPRHRDIVEFDVNYVFDNATYILSPEFVPLFWEAVQKEIKSKYQYDVIDEHYIAWTAEAHQKQDELYGACVHAFGLMQQFCFDDNKQNAKFVAKEFQNMCKCLFACDIDVGSVDCFKDVIHIITTSYQYLKSNKKQKL